MLCKICNAEVVAEKLNEDGVCEDCMFEGEEVEEYFAAMEEEQFKDGWHDDI